jgi:hypothetical protein
MELFQMAEITAEKVKCGCINNIREGKCYTFYCSRNEADSFSPILQITKKYVYTNLKFTFRFLFQKLGCFCQVWPKILAKDE